MFGRVSTFCIIAQMDTGSLEPFGLLYTNTYRTMPVDYYTVPVWYRRSSQV